MSTLRFVTARIFGDKEPRGLSWSEVPHIKVWGIVVPEHTYTLDVMHFENLNGCPECPGLLKGKAVHRLTLYHAEWQTVRDIDPEVDTTTPRELWAKVAALAMFPERFAAGVHGDVAAWTKQQNAII